MERKCEKCAGMGGFIWIEADNSERGERCDACDGFGYVAQHKGRVRMDEIEKKDTQYEIVRKLRHEADIASRTGQYDRLHYLADAVGRLCIEKQEFREEAVYWAEEAGRLKALLHDAQRDAGRLNWLRGDPASRNLLDNSWPWCVYIDRRDGVPTMMPVSGTNLDAAIDAAMAAEREGQG